MFNTCHTISPPPPPSILETVHIHLPDPLFPHTTDQKEPAQSNFRHFGIEINVVVLPWCASQRAFDREFAKAVRVVSGSHMRTDE